VISVVGVTIHTFAGAFATDGNVVPTQLPFNTCWAE